MRWVGSNQVISASTDNSLKLWDVADAAQSEGNCAPITSFTGERFLIMQHQLCTSVLATAALLCLSCVCIWGPGLLVDRLCWYNVVVFFYLQRLFAVCPFGLWPCSRGTPAACGPAPLHQSLGQKLGYASSLHRKYRA